MASDTPVVAIQGLKALERDINRLTKDVRSPLYAAMKRAGYRAVQPIVPATRSRLPQSDRPKSASHRPGRLAGSVRPSSYRSGAGVRMGSKAVPYAGWVEFGGTRHDPWESEREFVASGRYLFPAARELGPRAASEYSTALNDIFASSGVWTNTNADPEGVHD